MNIDALREDGKEAIRKKESYRGNKKSFGTKMRTLFHTNDINERMLLRCQCGELWWEDSPQEIMERHDGHRSKPAMGGTWWEFLKVKMGLIK